MNIQPIALIVTTFNSEKFIAETLQSIFDQTLQPAEVIVVDNGSTDGTERIVTALNIPFHVQIEGRVGTSRNLGLSKVSSPLVKFQDGDDLMLPEALQALAKALSANNADYVYGKSTNFIDETYAATAQKSIAHSDIPIGTPTVLNSLMHRRIFDTYGRPEEDNHSWNRWFSEATSKGLVAVQIDEHVGRRRVHGDNVSLQADAKSELFNLLAERIRRSKVQDEA